MQGILEIIFDVAFLGVVFTLAYLLLKNKGDFTIHSLFSAMALVLGIGDSFYIITKMLIFFSGTPNRYTALLGMGKLLVSIAITIFFLLLYMIYKLQYSVNNQKLTEILFYLFGVVRIILCLMPQNQWAIANPPVMWNLYRNVPFFAIGIILIILFVKEINIKKDRDFIFMPIAILLSFLFYIPVIVWQDSSVLIRGFIMLTSLNYLWIIWMGYSDLRRSLLDKKIMI